ncbi:hypothetical protein EGW08_022203 [Elysia chlorotica]|uniref:Uncharacterized protein n=1 Tax=Elysia chlorotica TaxID=188477 RepID=A0A433SLJ1_ELYCH|nr:hypothetical protein EGW08_022203 [Elysia chlorotica]
MGYEVYTDSGHMGYELYTDSGHMGYEVYTDSGHMGHEVYTDSGHMGYEVYTDSGHMGYEVYTDSGHMGYEVYAVQSTHRFQNGVFASALESRPTPNTQAGEREALALHLHALQTRGVCKPFVTSVGSFGSPGAVPCQQPSRSTQLIYLTVKEPSPPLEQFAWDKLIQPPHGSTRALVGLMCADTSPTPRQHLANTSNFCILIVTRWHLQ